MYITGCRIDCLLYRHRTAISWLDTDVMMYAIGLLPNGNRFSSLSRPHQIRRNTEKIWCLAGGMATIVRPYLPHDNAKLCTSCQIKSTLKALRFKVPPAFVPKIETKPNVWLCCTLPCLKVSSGRQHSGSSYLNLKPYFRIRKMLYPKRWTSDGRYNNLSRRS